MLEFRNPFSVFSQVLPVALKALGAGKVTAAANAEVLSVWGATVRLKDKEVAESASAHNNYPYYLHVIFGY